MKIGILGAGEYGKALGFLLRKSGNATYFFDPFVFPDRSLKDVVEFSDALLIAVPSSALSKLISQMPEAAFSKPLIVATKGIFDEKIFEKFQKFEIISGPGFAKEILKGRKVRITVASPSALDEKTLSEKIFSPDLIKFDKTNDVKGVLILGSLKNVYAIEAGRRGLVAETDEFKAFIVATLLEAQKVLIYNGGFVETVRLRAGIGDFVLTSGSAVSRNYQFGKRLGEFEREDSLSKRLRLGVWRAKGDARLKKMLKPRGTTVEGLSAIKRIEKGELFVPRECEILVDILRRIRNDVKF